MNFLAEWNRMYDFCMSNRLSKSEILLLHALYMINNKKDWDAWFEADNHQIQRLSGGLSRQSIIEARNKLKQRGRIDFKDGKRNTQSPFYRIITFFSILDIQVDIRGDKQVDKLVDKQGDPLSRLNQTKQSSSPDGDALRVADLFDTTYAAYPRKEGKAKGLASYRSYLTKGKEVSGVRYRFNHQQLYIAVSQYALDCEEKDRQFIKHFDTFMNGAVVDYVERTKAEYEAFMLEQYGENWREVRFRYA